MSKAGSVLRTLERRMFARQQPADVQARARERVLTLCQDTLELIDEGLICDWTGEWAARCESPTTAMGLQNPRYGEVFTTLHRMRELIGQYAKVTGWRSPSHREGDFRTWRAYRANSAVEMADVAREIMEWLQGE